MLLVIGICLISQAQLSHTQWKGTANVPDPATLLFNFKQDTLEVFLLPDSTVLETMLYTFKDSLLTIQKVSGGSPCDATTIGTYKLAIKDDKFIITLKEDACDARANAFIPDPWIKVKK